MYKFLINEGYSDTQRTIEAEGYETVGEFIDFFVRDGSATFGKRQIFRVRANQVFMIELKS